MPRGIPNKTTGEPLDIKTGQKPAGMISISQKDLDYLRESIQELRKDRDMLLTVADKKQMSSYYQRNKDKIPTKVYIRTFNRKVVLGWRNTKDIVEPDPTVPNRWIEDQRVELLFEDGTSSGEIFFSQFSRGYKQVEAEVRSRIVDEVSGNLALKVVRLDTGKEYTISATFIN
ncbi:MAG: hypothetical protein NTY61_02285 [Candidatus Parcubacteria bacterium]|nr:hypothetical protein [Candidatus Parcubacteria bacterium]